MPYWTPAAHPGKSDRMVIDPADVDWADQDDLEVILSARAGIPEAVAEAKQRNLDYGADEGQAS